MAQESLFLSYCPAAFFYREAVRRAISKAHAQELALMLCDEVELLKKEIREIGEQFGVELIPGRVYDPTSLLPDDRQLDLFQERA